jgi:uncharacterized phosphosugar-binding protein
MKNYTGLLTKKITNILNKISVNEETKILSAARYIAESYFNNGKLFLFGTGHNHCLAEEALHRAGGFANACPILDKKIDFTKGIKKATKFERAAGVATSILKKYNLQKNDALIIFSNSGVNKAPIEAAEFAKKIGLKVIAVVSIKYSKSIKTFSANKKLHDIADIFIDNKSPIGDSLIKVANNINIGTSSTITGSFILNAIFLELANLLKNEKPYPFFLSSNLKGANAHNRKLEKIFSKRNKFL